MTVGATNPHRKKRTGDKSRSVAGRAPNQSTKHLIYRSPIGKLLIESVDGKLTRLSMIEAEKHLSARPKGEADPQAFRSVVDQLDRYFAGELTRFDLPIALEGTEFQRRVWRELTKIPYGRTISYAELAERVGDPKAMRAVGSANGRNPIAIIVPCHRVIGSDGRLTGFGGGLDRKLFLLKLEGRLPTNGSIKLELGRVGRGFARRNRPNSRASR